MSIALVVITLWLAIGLWSSGFLIRTARAWAYATLPYQDIADLHVQRWSALHFRLVEILCGPIGMFSTMLAYEREYWRFK